MNVCIIQARMSSSRLPGKVLLDIAGKPMLQRVVERVLPASSVDQVVVATTTDPSDDPVAAFCAAQGYACTRGSLHDVLDRYIRAARQFDANVVVRVTADCPLIDPGLIDETVQLLIRSRVGVPGSGLDVSDVDRLRGPGTGTRNLEPGTVFLDFAANRLPPPWGRTYPIGLDVEVVTMAALERAWAEAKEKHYREHVMPYFYDDLPPEKLSGQLPYETPRGFCVAQLHHAEDFGDVRWTVDTPEDLAALRALTPLLPPGFSWLEALEIWQAHPEIAALNSAVPHKSARDVDSRS